MRALTVLPGVANSARLDDVAEPGASEGTLLVRALALGVCGTDREIVNGEYGAAPPGQERLILGHESFGEVIEAPPGGDFRRGDLVVGIVRHPDPVPCMACAAGEWDMCHNGQYTEHGIKELHGYGAERYRLEPEFTVKVDPMLGALGVLIEPASVVAKAWDHIDGIGHRARVFAPRSVLVTGSGPIGLLAAMMGRQRGLEVHVLDRHKEGLKVDLVRDLGGHHRSEIGDLMPDIIIECTGAWSVVRDVLGRTAPGGIICLTCVTAPGHTAQIDIGDLNRTMVLNNDTMFGSVNANRRHYELAAQALARADRRWLERLITRRVPLAQWQDALDARPDDIKVVIDFTM
jgi:threonine dehydrogenase-like Zn-dependent dehydrogenase